MRDKKIPILALRQQKKLLLFKVQAPLVNKRFLIFALMFSHFISFFFFFYDRYFNLLFLIAELRSTNCVAMHLSYYVLFICTR